MRAELALPRKAQPGELATKSWPVVWVIAVCFALFVQLATAQSAQLQSRFRRTVHYVQDTSADVRAEFATIALVNLAEAYIAEAEVARKESRAHRDASLRSWSSAVDQFTRQLPLLVEDIELGFPVSLGADGANPVAVTVADRTVILSHPRPGQQGVFEQEILAEFCLHHACEYYAASITGNSPIPVSASRVRPDWAFTVQGPVCSLQGIQVQFSSEANLANARLICAQFLQEVLMLADEISWQRRYAVMIEWDILTIESTPSRPEHVVHLNSAGDSVLVTIPVLYRSSGLLKDILPWMQQRLDGAQDPVIKLEAARYGWDKP